MRSEEAVSAEKVVLFIRRITRKIAGGSRSVFDRAKMFARQGYDVKIFVLEPDSHFDDALHQLRNDRILHASVQVIPITSLFRDRAASVRATYRRPITVNASAGGYDEVRILRARGDAADKDFLKDGKARYRLRCWPSGLPKTFEVLDEEERVVERWRHDVKGRLFWKNVFDPETQELRRKSFFVSGAIEFAEVDYTVPLGLGLVRRFETDKANITYAELVASYMDEFFNKTQSLFVVADGENFSQNILRAMKHPGVIGVSVLHNNHTATPFTSSAPTKKHWETFFTNLTNIHVMVCLTERQKTDLLERYPATPLHVINHPALDTVLGAVPRKEDRIVFVGRLSEQKRLDHLLAVFAKVIRAVPKATLDIYGEGSEESVVRQLVTQLELDKSVSLKGFTDEPLNVFASGGLSIMTSHYEGLPLTLIEAMSVGTPFVTYDLNYGPSEIIETGVNGILVEPGNIDQAADAVITLLNDSQRLRFLSENAKKVREVFTLQRHENDWLQVFAVAKERKSSSPDRNVQGMALQMANINERA